MAHRIATHRPALIGFALLLILMLAACGQAAPAAPVTPQSERAAPTASADQIRTPEGEIEAFWSGLAWDELTSAEQAAWGVLGWSAANWTETVNVPPSEQTAWADLSADEQAAATSLGYTQALWDATLPQN